MSKWFQKTFKMIKKKLCEKNIKIVILRSWKLIHDQQKFSTNLLSNPNGCFLTLEVQKIWIMTKCQKNEKNGKNCQKYAKIRDAKILQDNSI